LEADTLILSRVVERTHEELGIIEIEHHFVLPCSWALLGYNALPSPTTMACLLPVSFPGGGLGAEVAIWVHSCCVPALALTAVTGHVPVVLAHSAHVEKISVTVRCNEEGS
jgi:hypothetical protein